MYYLITPDPKHLILSREDIEDIKDFVREATGEQEVVKALESLRAKITTEIDPYLLH